MSETGFDYDRMVEDAMRGVLREALACTEAHGLPGNHHFYISFRTTAPGVRMPSVLRAQYPEEMTIVIQHQYWNLHVADESFEVELKFGGKREHLVVPFASVTGFVDPEAQFGLRFGTEGMISLKEESAPRHDTGRPSHPRIKEDEAGPRPKRTAGKMPDRTTDETPPATPGEKVVPLDQFRNKK